MSQRNHETQLRLPQLIEIIRDAADSSNAKSSTFRLRDLVPFSNQIRTVLDACRIVPAYLLQGLLKHLVPLRSLAKWTWCETTGPRDRLAERRLTANVLRLTKLLRIADGDCLQRSLLLYRLLSVVGADPELVVGLREQDGKIIGHAWVLVDETSLVEPESDLARFSPVLRFGARGALLSQVRADCEPKTLAR